MRCRLLRLVGGGLLWSGHWSTWRCAAALSCSCSASGRRRPRRSKSWCYATSLRCCAASIHGPPAAKGPGVAGGVEPSASTGALVGVACAARDAAALARRLVRRRWTHPTTSNGRPPVPEQVQRLVVRLAHENPRWGYQRIHGELLRLGWRVSPSSIKRGLRSHGLDPALQRAPTRSDALQRAGGCSCASRPPGSWPATSSPSTRSSCGACMSCCSSSLAAGACTFPASPVIQPACGYPAGAQSVGQPRRSDDAMEVPDPRSGQQVHQDVRRRVALHWQRGYLHAGSGAQCQRPRGTLGWDGPQRMPRPPANADSRAVSLTWVLLLVLEAECASAPPGDGDAGDGGLA